MIKMQHVRTLQARLLVLVTADTVEMERHVLVRNIFFKDWLYIFSLWFILLYSSYYSFYLCIVTSIFPDTPKRGNISFILWNGDAFNKKKYRPISVFQSLCSIFEILIENEVKPYTNTFMNPLLCGFMEGHSTRPTIPSSACQKF